MKIKAFIVALAVLVVPFLVVTSSVGAQTFRSSESTLIASDETIDGAAYIAGSTVDIAGTIKGDLYCAGQNVTISGEVDGDVLCAGQTLSISGKVTGNVRAAGQTVAVRGDIGKNVTIAGQTITLEREGRVGQDATLLGQSVAVTSPVARDLVINSSSATINAAIGRNVTANIESLQLSREANITGDLTYTSPVKLTRADGATVTGKVTYTEFKESTETATAGKAAVPFAAYFVWLVMLIASAVLFALLFPQVLSKTTALAAPTVPQGLLTTLVGFVAGIVMPFVIIFLMVTVLGIPFALVALLAWLLILSLIHI